MREVIVHTCCARCIPYVRKSLEEEGYYVISLWYNPNIHPYEEYLRRRKALEKYSSLTSLNVIFIDEYPLTTILEKMSKLTINNPLDRCKFCYRIRLAKTANFTLLKGYSYFTTTLLVSPYQKHELISRIGNEIANKFGINFLYRDFREGYTISNSMIQNMNLYRQHYCGCIFSEYEKHYLKKINKI